ncbi:MAG: TIGR00269 family protein [Candidatus Thorarchaeota archaeon]|nr:TIGR00269 family protein [Candidatus Thorarchaeota archaeon]
MPIACSKCGKPAIYLRRYTAEQLCKSCLVKTTQLRVQKTINKGKMLHEEDRIAVAISGGKDSAVLLEVLSRIEEEYPKTELVPLTIDEGIKGYRDKALDAARELCSKLGMTLEIRTFKDLFGHSLDWIVENRKNSSTGACSYCGVLRRQALNTASLEIEADVVVTGHNLDDEAQTILMNIMRGDSRRIARTNRFRSLPIPGLVPRVKPIKELGERDIVAYAHHLDLPYHDITCPYADEAYRNDIRIFLNEMEHRRPGTLLAILRSGDSIAEVYEQMPQAAQIHECASCGMPSSKEICKACSLLAEFGG